MPSFTNLFSLNQEKENKFLKIRMDAKFNITEEGGENMDAQNNVQQSIFSIFLQNIAKSSANNSLTHDYFSTDFKEKLLAATDKIENQRNTLVKKEANTEKEVNKSNVTGRKTQKSAGAEPNTNKPDNKSYEQSNKARPEVHKKATVNTDIEAKPANIQQEVIETKDTDADLSLNELLAYIIQNSNLIKLKDNLKLLRDELGISQDELSSMMSFLGINPQDLAVPEKVDEVVAKISEFANLTKEQENILKEIFKGIDFSAIPKSESIPEFETLKIKNNQGHELNVFQKQAKACWVEVKGLKIFQGGENKDFVNIEEIKQKIKSKLEESSEKIKLSGNKTKIIQNASEMLEKVEIKGTKGTTELKQVNTKEENNITLNAENNKAEILEAEVGFDENKAENGFVENSGKDFKKEWMPKTGETSKNKEIEAFHGIISDPKGSMAKAMETVTKTTIISKNEIINQVLEKAKVLLNGDKSEMIMELKPDSLGKVSLKVVTERGIVTAQFVAENEQVKAALEANMQILKDSLEKQGLSVQGFSVSVGNNNLKGNREYEMNNGTKSSNNHVEENIEVGYVARVDGIAMTQGTKGMYMPYGSTVNFIA